MLREIKKKMVILRNRAPFSPEVKAYLRQLENREWVYMNLRLFGSGLSRENIDTVLEGGYILGATVDEHLLIERMGTLREYIYHLTDMGTTVSMNVLQDMHRIITESKDQFRKTNPILLEYDHNPMMPADIPKAMESLIRFAVREELGENPFTKAARLHNRLLEIYPYKEGNQLLARALMYYYLIGYGYPMAPLSMSEQTYNEAIMTYLKKGDSEALSNALAEGVLHRLTLMMQLTEAEK
ncbi:MAG: hypothetical protein HFE73_04400 [Firmicutes bacterium]|nr:hypothetical protein [Bacillota bacterium]